MCVLDEVFSCSIAFALFVPISACLMRIFRKSMLNSVWLTADVSTSAFKEQRWSHIHQFSMNNLVFSVSKRLSGNTLHNGLYGSALFKKGVYLFQVSSTLKDRDCTSGMKG